MSLSPLTFFMSCQDRFRSPLLSVSRLIFILGYEDVSPPPVLSASAALDLSFENYRLSRCRFYPKILGSPISYFSSKASPSCLNTLKDLNPEKPNSLEYINKIKL